MNNSTIDQAKSALHEGRIDEAARHASSLIAIEPDNLDARYILAVTHRYAGRPHAAHETLDALLVKDSGYGRAWQECGHLHRATGNYDAAAIAYARAVRHNPALIASWKALIALAEAQGNRDLAAQAHESLDDLEARPGPYRAIFSMIHEGRVADAESKLREILQRDGTNIHAMRMLAEIGMKLKILDDAETLLDNAAAFAPGHFGIRLDLVRVLMQRQKFAAAVEAAHACVAIRPGSISARSLLADALAAAGRSDEAIANYDALVNAGQGLPGNALMRGHALKTAGRGAEAIASYRLALDLAPDLGDAWWSLANLKTYQFGHADIARMRTLVDDAHLAEPDRAAVAFALGKALECVAPDESFDRYEQGNAIKARAVNYDADAMHRAFERQKSVCTAAFFGERSGRGAPEDAPIFIVGLPRAGSTLIEQILASHSHVDGTMELHSIMGIAHGLGGTRAYPECLTELDAGQCAALGQRYLDEAAPFRAGAPRFTDKMPNNFRHLGLIRLILPNARIIDARRDPMDCGYSIWRQLFAEGQHFAYSLDDIGRYYRDYASLMAHWERVMPDRLLRVQHEDVLDDLEGQVRRILDFLNLPFETACLEFHRTERSVQTASAEQVRRPLNRDGVGQWRRNETRLRQLKDAVCPDKR